MTTDLARFIEQTPIIDTHEHMAKEADYLTGGFDILRSLFDNYVGSDLCVAGATQEQVNALLDTANPDIAARFAPVREAWERCKHTGYGEGVRLIAERFYGMEEITVAALEAVKDKAAALHRPGERFRMLKEMANLDHVQVDDFRWECPPDESGPDFFLYDLSWASFVNGAVEVREIEAKCGVRVTDLATLREAMAALFTKYAPCAIAVKSQHAYARTLAWEERTDAEAEAVLRKSLAGEELTSGEKLCLGDWGLARGVELAIEHDLPFKIHTGYLAGYTYMQIDGIRAGLLCPLLARYLKARFVLMHTAYPYGDELIALAKHFPNVYIDLCWAWSINPLATTDFVRRYIHAAPINKLFVFGGDSFIPTASVAYAIQARRALTRALQGEVADGLMTEREAIAVAERFMRRNQEECFDIAGTRRNIREALRTSP
jgi:predicted TIM-barrel fold metal-dependent hydrolase